MELQWALFLIVSIFGLMAAGLVVIAFSSNHHDTDVAEHDKQSRIDTSYTMSYSQGGRRSVHVRPLPQDSRMDKRTMREIQKSR